MDLGSQSQTIMSSRGLEDGSAAGHAADYWMKAQASSAINIQKKSELT